MVSDHGMRASDGGDHNRGSVEPVGSLLLNIAAGVVLEISSLRMLSLLALSKLSADPSVPLFGKMPYAYGEGAVPTAKKPCTSFGVGGQDPLCQDCFDDPPGGQWHIYSDPTWDFSADEPIK